MDLDLAVIAKHVVGGVGQVEPVENGRRHVQQTDQGARAEASRLWVRRRRQHEGLPDPGVVHVRPPVGKGDPVVARVDNQGLIQHTASYGAEGKSALAAGKRKVHCFCWISPAASLQ